MPSPIANAEAANTPATEPLELARQLESMRRRLQDLWLRPESADDRAEIDRQLRAVGGEIIRLISINVAAGTPAYDSATAALRHANEQLTGTLREGAAARGTLEAVAKAIELVGRVGALAG